MTRCLRCYRMTISPCYDAVMEKYCTRKNAPRATGPDAYSLRLSLQSASRALDRGEVGTARRICDYVEAALAGVRQGV